MLSCSGSEYFHSRGHLVRHLVSLYDTVDNMLAEADHQTHAANMGVSVRVHHRYTPRYQRQTRTCTRNGSVPAPRVWVWSRVPSLVPVPVPAAGIPVEYEQGGRAKVRATQATAQRARWCALYRRFCSSQGGDGMAGASSSSGCVASRRLRCEDETGASSSSSSGQQGRVVVVASSGASPVVA